MSPRTNLFIFVISVGVVIFLILDLVNIHLPFAARYILALLAVALYILLTKIKARINTKPKSAKINDEKANFLS